MYETSKEIIEAQRELGLDCAMIDAFNPRAVQDDDGFKSEPFTYADGADVYVMHSHIPEPYLSDGTPVVCCLHGMPVYSWQSECYYQERRNDAPWSQIVQYFAGDTIARFVTFWEQHLIWWKVLDAEHGGKRVRYVQRPIGLGDLALDGPKRELEGAPVLVLADHFRLCKDPFQLWFGARHYYEQNPNARLHQYALPPPESREYKSCARLLDSPSFRGFVGHVENIVEYLPEVFCAADILLTSVPVASRIVAEAKACGCDVISAGAVGTVKADVSDPLDIAERIDAIWRGRSGNIQVAREANAREARELWNPLETARQMITVYEELV